VTKSNSVPWSGCWGSCFQGVDVVDKSSTGHLLGAAGAIEAIFSILAIRDNIARTINLDNRR